jgi:hypothetical protein
MKNKNFFKLGGIVFTIIVVILLIIVAGGALVSGMVRSTEFYKHSVDIALNDRTVLRKLGEPVEASWWVIGSISTGGLTQEGELRIPLKGSKESGVLFAAGRQDAGVWTYFNLVVRVSSSGEIIDLRR